VGYGVVLINDPRPRATIHGRPQAEVETSRVASHLQRRPENIAYMTMFFEGARASVAAGGWCSLTPLQN
jgi:hypothetical protein